MNVHISNLNFIFPSLNICHLFENCNTGSHGDKASIDLLALQHSSFLSFLNQVLNKKTSEIGELSPCNYLRGKCLSTKAGEGKKQSHN